LYTNPIRQALIAILDTSDAKQAHGQSLRSHQAAPKLENREIMTKSITRRASELAYDKIRKFVLSGSALPGEQLTEEQLSRVAGVSRTPVREAISRLESELLIVRSTSKRLFVADWSANEIEEMFVLRGMLEGHAASRAARFIGAEQMAKLLDISDRLDSAVAAEKPAVTQFLDCNRQFHDLILEAARSPRLTTILTMLIEQPVVRRTAAQYQLDDLRQSAREHRELIAAFGARDQHWARAVMTSHIRRAYHVFNNAAVRRAESKAGHASAIDG
jgi:DNA-binding GntR family transcriptional regulator